MHGYSTPFAIIQSSSLERPCPLVLDFHFVNIAFAVQAPDTMNLHCHCCPRSGHAMTECSPLRKTPRFGISQNIKITACLKKNQSKRGWLCRLPLYEPPSHPSRYRADDHGHHRSPIATRRNVKSIHIPAFSLAFGGAEDPKSSIVPPAPLLPLLVGLAAILVDEV